jgi:SAM-dependent methyltransferase
MNGFLKTHAEITQATQTIRNNGWVEHGLDCKNWDIVQVMPHLGDGNFLDMGSYGSSMLYNVVKAGFTGLKYGIDLAYPEGYVLTSPPDYNTPTLGVRCFGGDLMRTPFESGLFKYITCLSTIEHQVDFNIFASEVSRLLSQGGRAFVTFDYWNPKVGAGFKWGGLDWNILDKKGVEDLIVACEKQGLKLDGDVDWTTQDQVINPHYCSGGAVSYTFGILHFIKQ